MALEWQRGRDHRTRDRPGFQLETPGAAGEGVRPRPALGKTRGWTLFRVLEHSVPRDGCPPGGGQGGEGAGRLLGQVSGLPRGAHPHL